MSMLGIYLGFSVIVLFLTFVALLGHGIYNNYASEIVIGVLGFIILGITFIHAVFEYHEPTAMEDNIGI